MTVAKEQIAWRSQPNAGWCCAVQRANVRHSVPTSGNGSDWAFKRRHSGQNLRTNLDREQRSARMTTLEAANGKSYEPEPVKGSGLNIWDWRPTLLFGLVAWTAA